LQIEAGGARRHDRARAIRFDDRRFRRATDGRAAIRLRRRGHSFQFMIGDQAMTEATKEEVREALLAFGRAHGIPARRALLERVAGCTSPDEVPASKFEALIAATKRRGEVAKETGTDSLLQIGKASFARRVRK
jgi:hypothetical protein